MSETLHMFALYRRNPLDKYRVIGYYKMNRDSEKIEWRDELPFGYGGMEFRDFIGRELRMSRFMRSWIDESSQALTDMALYFSDESRAHGYTSLTDLNKRFKRYYKENKAEYKRCLKRAKKDAYLEACCEYRDALDGLEYVKSAMLELTSAIDILLEMQNDFLSESDDVQICYCFS